LNWREMTGFRKGITRLEAIVWLLCAVIIGTTLFSLYRFSQSSGSTFGEKVLDMFTPRGIPFSRDLTTILLMGVDERQKDAGRADTMILVYVNVRDHKLAMYSIPRDTWWFLRGKEETKMAHFYSLGRVRTVVTGVESLLGENIDYYVKVNFNGIQKIVNAMGGVEINVEERMKYKDEAGKLFIDLQPGRQRLNGYQAMCYVRFRADKSSDYGRMRRQKEFLLAAYRELHANHSLAEIANIAVQAWRNVDTDLSRSQVLWLAQRMEDVDLNDVKLESVPSTEGQRNGMSVLLPKVEEARRIAQELRLRTATGFVLDRQRAKVQVLNGTKVKGAVVSVANTVKALGYNVVYGGNASSNQNASSNKYLTSKIFATPEAKGLAEEMGKELGISKVYRKEGHSLTDPDIYLIVGEDLAAAQPPSAGARSSSPGSASSPAQARG